MLHEFLTLHRERILARARPQVAATNAPSPADAEPRDAVALYLEQLVDALRREGPMLPPGAEPREAGSTVAQVVHDCGELRQAVTELAIELQCPISAEEFRTLNRRLDEAIVRAVTEHAHPREPALSDHGTERLGFFAHELRNLLGNAMLAFELLRSGKVGIGGSTAGVLGRNLMGLRDLVDRSLAEVRLDAGLHRREHVALTDLVTEVELAAAIEANARGHQLMVTPVEPGVEIEVDRQLIAAALANLLQNAFKFSRPNGHVVLRTETATASGRVLIEVEDECGGLAPDGARGLFRAFERRSADRSGLGLGLTIARKSVETNGGEIRARSLAGRGCIFTIDLPRLSRESATAAVEVPAVGRRGGDAVTRGGIGPGRPHPGHLEAEQ